MQLPSPGTLGLAYGLSEFALSLWKRSREGDRRVDRSSLRLLWGVILVSVAAAVVAAYELPAERSQWLAMLYPAGVALFVAGIALRWGSILYLGRFFTVDVAIASDHRVVDTGPYRWVRHPSYTGALLAFAGFGLCLGNWASLALLVVPIMGAFLRRIVVEERALLEALGPDYAAYARRTKRLIPFVY